MRQTAFAFALASALWGSAALAGGIVTPGMPAAGDYPNTLPLTGNERIPADTTLPSGVDPQSEAITVQQIASYAQGIDYLVGLIVGNGVSSPTAVAPGTGVLSALAQPVGSPGGFVVNGGVLGTPSSGTLTHATGLPIATGVAGLGSGVASALAQPIGGTGGVQALVAPTQNVGSVCGYPTANQPCVGGTTSAGFLMAGNIAIGNNIPGIDTFVAVWDNNIFTNPNQEMRGVTVALGETRSNADASIGWDIIPFSASSVIEATNTQAIIGNLKGYYGETILGAGTYTVTHAYPFQASLTSVGAGVTLSYWAGMVVSQGPAGCATQCSAVYGLDIGYQYGVSSAAVYIRGEGPGQAIKFPTTSIYEDTSGKLNLNPASNYLVIANPLTATTASSGTYTPPTTVQGYLQVILGGNAYKIAYYQP